MAFHLNIRYVTLLSACLLLLAVVGCNPKNTAIESSDASSATEVTSTSETFSSSDIPSDAFLITEDNGKYFLTGEYGNITADACVCTTRDVYDPGTVDVIRAQMRVFDETDIAKEVQSTWVETSHTVDKMYAPMVYDSLLYDLDTYTYSDPVLGDIGINETYYGIGYTTDSEKMQEMSSALSSGILSGDIVPVFQNDISDSQTLITDYYDRMGVTLSENYLVYSSSVNGSDFEYYRLFQSLNNLAITDTNSNSVIWGGEQCMTGITSIYAYVADGAFVDSNFYGYFDQTSVITEDATLCTLEAATNTAVAALASTGGSSASIYEIQLAYLPILDAGADNDYYMLPCWVFVYHEAAAFSTDTKCVYIDATSGQWIETTSLGFENEA